MADLRSMETVATKIPLATKQKAAAVAKRRKISLSGLLRTALENELKADRPRTWGERFGVDFTDFKIYRRFKNQGIPLIEMS